MNILHVLPSAFPGGSELCAFETIQVLKEDGFENFVVVPKRGPLFENLSKEASAIFVVENNWWISNPAFSFLLKIQMLYGYFRSIFKIKKIIKDNQIDLVITHTIGIPCGAFASKLAGVPHIWYIHEYGDIDHNLKFNYGKKTSLFLANILSKKIIVNSSALLLHYLPYFSTDKIDQINYVVNYPQWQPMLTKESQSLSICMVGRIAAGKNQMIALQALYILKAAGIMPHITFVGGVDPSYFILLDNFIKENDLAEQITFAGHSDAPWEHVRQADCILICSKNEAFGRVTVEAMKSGRIAIVSNTGAGKELIKHEVTGFLFNPENVNELVHILKHLWEITDTRDITTRAFDFATVNFNPTVHALALQKSLKQCL
ncbi:glycosyltransferase family 4 protein [Cytophaga aurantiaca]|uniref:glycosyltransferase family 4 protein n=1 Tax=Cytophaga aurantiaca TaxID=29530 RepID=UPI00035DF4E6|nr:glycosyltransferase family 4 protein [Cytophaga aurantiaca]